VVDILRVMDGEDANIAWSSMHSVLVGLYVQLEEIGGAPLAAFTTFGKRAVLTALQRVGWDPRPGDDHSALLLRSTVIGLLDTFAHDDPAVVAEARYHVMPHAQIPTCLLRRDFSCHPTRPIIISSLLDDLGDSLTLIILNFTYYCCQASIRPALHRPIRATL
jgi:hypothetical protein